IVRIDTRAASAQDVLNYPITAAGGGVGASLVGAPLADAATGGMGGGGMGSSGATGTAATPTPNSQSLTPDFQNHPRVVYVKDVARVVDSYWERRSAYHFLDHDPGTGGQVIPSIEVSVIQDPGASSAFVVPAVRKVLDQLAQENPGV